MCVCYCEVVDIRIHVRPRVSGEIRCSEVLFNLSGALQRPTGAQVVCEATAR